MELINCEHIQVKYDEQVVIDDLSFKINYGDYLCIVGDNGAGKSTLLKCLLGLKNISQGKLVFSSDLKKNQIGYVPQGVDDNDDFPATVREIVLSGCLNQHGFFPSFHKSERHKTDTILEELNMGDFKDRSFRELSGGQKKRVLLARALMASEKLLIMDEPVAALDPIATAEFYDTVRKLNQKEMTIVMVSHDIHAAVHNASHILHLSGQQPNFFGTKEEYLKSDAGRAYLGDHGSCAQCHNMISPYILDKTGNSHSHDMKR